MCEWGNTELVLIANGKMADVDSCLVNLVKCLNANGHETVASCCGHGKGVGNIALKSGQELIIAPDWETARKIDEFVAEHIIEKQGELIIHDTCGQRVENCNCADADVEWGG